MTTAAEQVQYESRVRFRWAIVAFTAAILLVASQLVVLSATQSPVSETTLTIIAYNSSATVEVIATVLSMIGLIALGLMLFWIHRSAQARQPGLRSATRVTVAIGGVLTGVMAMVSTVLITEKAHTFVTTGNQSYPEAHQLFGSTALLVPQLFGTLGNLLLAIGVVLVALSAMRVGLLPRMLAYAGVFSGALFIIGQGLGALATIIQGFWLVAMAVLLARRWPGGDPPAWESGVAVAWPPTARQLAQQDRANARQQQRGGRRRVSDKEVLAAVGKNEAPPNPRAGRSKRKRRK